MGNRSIGRKIALQGGVAKNKAVPLAFALFLNQDIIMKNNLNRYTLNILKIVYLQWILQSS